MTPCRTRATSQARAGKRSVRVTEAEREVALLLLKGLSLREIAGLRETSERTVRHQSLAVYRKAGLAGRAELSAYFLEDLLGPRQRERRRM
ncbi:MAG TPA: LuxR C-terminal-related transcriptional regulator [Myxococcaceae bacterium]|nr:LuxR C-terminal-related transcriptional regulator [Myxococcaceae bacterium]